MGICLMKIEYSATTICMKAFIIYITVTVPATSPCLHLKNNQSLLSSVSQLSRSPSPPLSLSGFMCIIMLSMTYRTTISFQTFFLDIFNMFPVPLLVVLRYKSHQFICNLQQFLEVHTCCDVFMCESL